MSRGIIYLMSTVVPGLVKIGKTGNDNYESRMYSLEHNGYSNVAGLKREFAIEVDDYDEKERLLHNIFSKSRVDNTELFAIDVDLVIQLLSSFEGKQIYPKDMSKTEVFETATVEAGESEEVEDEEYTPKGTIPNGKYYLKQKMRAWDRRTVNATMEVVNGKYILKAGSLVCPVKTKDNVYTSSIEKKRGEIKIIDNMTVSDIEFNSPSYAGAFVVYGPCNGWKAWKTWDGTPLDFFRDET